MTNRITIPADMPLISGENVSTINGQAIIGKNAKDVDFKVIDVIYKDTNYKNVKCIFTNLNIQSFYNKYKYSFMIDDTLVFYFYVSVGNEVNTIYIKKYNKGDVVFSQINGRYALESDESFNNFVVLTKSYSRYTYSTSTDRFIISSGTNSSRFGAYSSLNFSLGSSIAVDAVETISINTLTDSKIIINSIQPTTAVEGLIISTPFYNGTNWCIQIYNKSTASFNGDLKIDYIDFS